MPLPPAGPREEMHGRNIDIRGYRRPDGLYDIEGHLTDIKTSTFTPSFSKRTVPPGEPVHDMWIRLVVDIDLLIHDAEAIIDLHPYHQCHEAAGAIKAVIGLSIGPGWQGNVNKRLARNDNCTHLRELLIPMASGAYQALAQLRSDRNNRVDADGRPLKIGTCYTYGADKDQVLIRWPAFYTGSKTSL